MATRKRMTADPGMVPQEPPAPPTTRVIAPTTTAIVPPPAPEEILVRCLVAHDTMRARSVYLVPLTDRVIGLIDVGYLEVEPDEDPPG